MSSQNKDLEAPSPRLPMHVVSEENSPLERALVFDHRGLEQEYLWEFRVFNGKALLNRGIEVGEGVVKEEPPAPVVHTVESAGYTLVNRPRF